MDPNETLRQLRLLAADILRLDDDSPADDVSWRARTNRMCVLAAEIAELWQSLDEWLSKGGFSPWVTDA